MIRFIARGALDFGKAVLAVAGCILCAMGALAVADIWHRDNLPAIVAARRPVPSGRVATWKEIAALDDAGRWQRLQPPLGILDDVCPVVSEWTRDCWQRGHLVFERAEKGRLAAWYVVPRRLVINYHGLVDTNEEMACTLAHEFRHSRQGLLLFSQVSLGLLFGVDRRDRIEGEAYEWEDRVRRAIRGR